jgi:hypothetical protein
MEGNLPFIRKGGKKERIRELIFKGSYTDQEIARMVSTTIANVWKEKSQLRGVLMRQKVERSDKTVLLTSAPQDLYGIAASRRKGIRHDYEELLDIPPIDSAGMKILYNDINAGRRPNEIIAAHGFNPLVVQTEYNRSNVLHHDSLLKRIISEVIIWKTGYRGIQLLEKYENEGHLSEDDIIQLLKEHTQAAQEVGAGIQRSVLGL